jgi:alpha-1,2-mannosyltransferase
VTTAQDGPDSAVAGQRDGGPSPDDRILTTLLRIAVVNLVAFCVLMIFVLGGRRGLLLESGAPFGGDFVNLWTTGKMILSGAAGAIYDPVTFVAFQQTLLPADIGLRLWAYPPHSLLLAWPFGILGYFVGFAVLSLLGLFLLAFGARRFGFGWKEIAVLVLSPAALSCVAFGQTGNIAAGLLLVALSARSRLDASPIAAAALLTIKPQTGFLLPLIWIGQKRWLLVAATGVAALAVIGLSIGLFGIQPWRDYLGLTMPQLSALERFGSGPFTVMIPSVFMSLRLVGLDGDRALFIHATFAAVVLLTLVWRLWRAESQDRRTAMVLIATVLITPYTHMYDLTILVVAALLMLRAAQRGGGLRKALFSRACAVLWLAPYLVYGLGVFGVPITPLLLVIAFFIV